MSTKENAKYLFSTTETFVQPLNADLTQALPTNHIGGVGPFDFSGVAAIAAVPFKSKIDGGATESITIDLSGAASQSAVTVAELFAAINTATPTDLTASAEAVTGRLKIVYSGAGTPSYLQIWGESAELGLIGQGIGTRIAYSDTMKSVALSPIQKDEETFTTTDSNGFDTEVLSDGYRKGVSGTLTDAADDWYLCSVIDGGTYDETAGTYSVGTSLTSKRYFNITSVSARYAVGTNKEADLVDYIKTVIYSAKGSASDQTIERGFVDPVFNFTATSPKTSGSPTSDTVKTEMTIAEYATAAFSTLDSF
jgi:hypothetical protein